MIKLNLALIPLDERPVNTRYPKMIGAIAGVQVHVPPFSLLGARQIPANLEDVSRWLEDHVSLCDALIISCDFLGFGNLIATRISTESAYIILSRLQQLAELNCRKPVHAFSVITRVANANDCVEEPDYWETWGTDFARIAALWHQKEAECITPPGTSELSQLLSKVPKSLVNDWTIRRLRNHIVNLGLLEMAANNELSSLSITSDDSSVFGFPTRERSWLNSWIQLANNSVIDRVKMYPGADEVGSVLIAREIHRLREKPLRILPIYAFANGEYLVAPYEDRPVWETVNGQIAAAGACIADSESDADIVLGIVTPVPGRGDYHPDYTAEDRPVRENGYRKFLDKLAHFQHSGLPIALADVAYPNGADPLLMELILAENMTLDLSLLSAYGAWNTAGNTLGVVVAQAICWNLGKPDAQGMHEQNLFLTHRFLEDYGYQTLVRRELRQANIKRWGRSEPNSNSEIELEESARFTAIRLNDVLRILQSCGVGVGLEIKSGTVRLPWKRTFEIDFELCHTGT